MATSHRNIHAVSTQPSFASVDATIRLCRASYKLFHAGKAALAAIELAVPNPDQNSIVRLLREAISEAEQGGGR